jgi:hypothetical protein
MLNYTRNAPVFMLLLMLVKKLHEQQSFGKEKSLNVITSKSKQVAEVIISQCLIVTKLCGLGYHTVMSSTSDFPHHPVIQTR